MKTIESEGYFNPKKHFQVTVKHFDKIILWWEFDTGKEAALFFEGLEYGDDGAMNGETKIELRNHILILNSITSWL